MEGQPTEEKDAAAVRARALEASRAAARRYKDSLKKTPKRAASPTDDEQSSSKKPKRHGDGHAASPSSPADTSKEARRLASRRHAREYARTLAARKTEPEDLTPITVPAPLPTPTDWVQPDPEPKGDSPPEVQSPVTLLGSSEVKGLDVRAAPGYHDVQASPIADTGRLGAGRASTAVPAPLPPTPAMPDVFSARSRRDPDPLPSVLPYRKPTPSAVASPRPRVNSVQPERAAQGQEAIAQRPRRESFLRYAAVNSGEPGGPSARPRQRRVSLPQSGAGIGVPVEERRRPRPEALPETKVQAARPEGDSIRVPFSWTRTGLMALAPLLLSGLTWGLLIPAWAYARPALEVLPDTLASLPSSLATAARGFRDIVPTFGSEARRTEKCFLVSGEDPSICKPGAEEVLCPLRATCGLGRILSCDFPFDTAADGGGCVLMPTAAEEVDVVLRALTERTIAEQCWGSGLLLPTRSKSSVTLGEAADAAGRQHLSLVASMPSGNVADLVELEGSPSSDDWMARSARLSDAALSRLNLPIGCKVRLWVIGKALAYWKALVGIMAVFTAALWRDLVKRKRYRRHVEVCSMRDESYKALLDHASRDPAPMQVGHIQDFVADKRRGQGEGGTASAKKLVRCLWPDVEREIELDSRIRRSYKNVRGQNNVPCWEWLAPAATLDTIGALDPGPPPRMWLLPSKPRRSSRR